MVRLPEEACSRLQIHPSTEFDVMFQMPPMRLARIFDCLGKEKTHYVSISVKDNGGVDTVSFIKDVLPPGEDEFEDEGEKDSNDKYQVSCSHNAKAPTCKIGETYIHLGQEFEAVFCMTCLYGYIMTKTVLSKDWTRVVMCLGQELNMLVYTNRVEQFNWFIIPSGGHIIHTKAFREFVQQHCLRDFEQWEHERASAARMSFQLMQGSHARIPVQKFDAWFSMPMCRFREILRDLSVKNSHNVLIEIKKKKEGNQVMFIKVKGFANYDGNLFIINGTEDVVLDCVSVRMQENVWESGVSASICLTCLSEHLYSGSVEEQTGSRVTVCLSQDLSLPTQLFSSKEKIDYFSPAAWHYHEENERQLARMKTGRYTKKRKSRS